MDGCIVALVWTSKERVRIRWWKWIKLKKGRCLFDIFRLCFLCIWDLKGGIDDLQSCGKSQPSFVFPQIWLCVRFLYVFPYNSLFFPVIYCHYVTCLLPVPPHIHRTTSWFSPPLYCVESSFRYHGDEKRGSEEALSNSLYLRNAESHVLSCVFCVKVDRKCQNRCTSASDLLANSAPLL